MKYPNRKLGFHNAIIDDPYYFGCVAMANMKEGEIIPSEYISLFDEDMIVQKFSPKSLALVGKNSGKTRRIKNHSEVMFKLFDQVNDLISAQHHMNRDICGDLLVALKRDPTYNVIDEVITLVDPPNI